MNGLGLLVLIGYLLVIAVVCVYGAHRYWMVLVYLRRGARTRNRRPKAHFADLPRVTVQLPMFNEQHVAERVIEAGCHLDYPRDKLQIQVLDDSTDESARIAAACCARMVADGHDVAYIHRDNREGYKAGALENGLQTATGDFIAVFDADFVPPPHALQETIHHFSDETIGMVQLCWGHLNSDDTLLTCIQAMFLDGHFVVEQSARAGSDRWFNFNGTAGVWRRQAIEEAGGWEHDTLTEDTDLSYRAQLAGWRFRYLADVICPAEVPPTMVAFMRQQHRWNKGLVQTAIKLLPRIMRAPVPLKIKVESFFHLTSPMMHPVILMLVLLIIPALFIEVPLEQMPTWSLLTLGGGFLLLGAMAVCTFYLASQWGRVSPWRALMRMPALMAIGVGISVINTKAVLEALLGLQTPFIRTPKFADQGTSAADPALAGGKRRLPHGLVEVALGVLMLVAFLSSFLRPHVLVASPFVLMFACGLLAVGLPALRDSLPSLRPRVG